MTQCRLACYDRRRELVVYGVGEGDGGRAVVLGAVVVWCFEVVAAGAPAFDDAGVGAVAAERVEVPLAGDLGLGGGEDRLSLLRGERPGLRPGG